MRIHSPLSAKDLELINEFSSFQNKSELREFRLETVIDLSPLAEKFTDVLLTNRKGVYNLLESTLLILIIDELESGVPLEVILEKANDLSITEAVALGGPPNTIFRFKLAENVYMNFDVVADVNKGIKASPNDLVHFAIHKLGWDAAVDFLVQSYAYFRVADATAYELSLIAALAIIDELKKGSDVQFTFLAEIAQRRLLRKNEVRSAVNEEGELLNAYLDSTLANAGYTAAIQKRNMRQKLVESRPPENLVEELIKDESRYAHLELADILTHVAQAGTRFGQRWTFTDEEASQLFKRIKN